MELLQHFHRLYAYDEWANREALAFLQKTAAPPSRAVKFFAHIIARIF